MFRLLLLGTNALFIIIFVILTFGVWIWAIIDCLKSKLSTQEKLLWMIIILFFHFLGALVYLIVVKSMNKRITKKDDFKGKKLVRSKKNRIIAGVCAGVGQSLDVDPTMVRLLWVILTLFSAGAGILGYIIACIIIPEKK